MFPSSVVLVTKLKWHFFRPKMALCIKIFAVIVKHFQTLLPNDAVLTVLSNEMTDIDCLMIIALLSSTQ